MRSGHATMPLGPETRTTAMMDPVRRTSRYQALRDSRRVLARMAPLVRIGLWALGVSVFLNQVRPLLSDAQFTWGERRVMAIVAAVTFTGFGLAGWVASRLLKASAELIDLLVDSGDAAWRTADLIELQMVPTLGRIAAALERRDSSDPRDGFRERAVESVRSAIAAQRWDQAEQLIAALGRDFPNAAEAATLTRDLGRERTAVVDRLRRELEAGRADQDPDRVIDARDALTQHLRGAPLHDLDQDVVRWLTARIQAQTRAQSVSIETARLAARVADSFGDTAEGASMRASLPALRRKAGLCPRCGRKSKETSELCPRCTADRAASASFSPSGAPIPKESP